MKRYVVAAVLLLSAMVLRAADTAPAVQIPAGEAQAKERLEKSPRHPEFVDITIPGSTTPMKSLVVFPERADKAPVVIVIMEIFGLSDWLRATCDQLAADGFIAIAPDFLSGKGPNGGGSESFTNRGDITRLVSGIKAPDAMAAIGAAREYGLKLPSCNGKSATIGFCWGGTMSFAYAAAQPDLNAAVVFYGTAPADDALAKIKAPIAGFYGGNDNRVTSTVAGTTEKMKRLEKSYDPHVYEGAGHGFVRAQGPDRPADLKAVRETWPLAVKFIRENTK